MYQRATRQQVQHAHGSAAGRFIRWLVGVVILFIAMGGFGIFSALQSPSPVTCTPPACAIPPPRAKPITGTQTYTSSAYGYSVIYSTANITPSSTDKSSIAWDAQLSDGSEVAWSFHGVKAGGRGAEQLVNEIQSANFPDANQAYTIPEAELGYTPGYGNVYDYTVSPGNGQSLHDRLILIAAIKKGVGVVFVGVGPYQRTTPDDGHPNPADTPLVQLGDVEQTLQSVSWKGDTPL